MDVGIEAINAYVGSAYIDVRRLFEARGLDLERFDNLMMEKKAVSLPCEDAVTNAVNAALPLLAAMSDEEKQQIELVITASESGTDFAKSMSTHIHKYLGLNKNCRLFELKQACYGGTAALQMAASWVKSEASPGAKALILATDVVMLSDAEIGEDGNEKFSYAEPSAGEAAIAMLVSDTPTVLNLDFGANGYFSYEVADVCRPSLQGDAGDPDLSLLSYLDCVEGSFNAYAEKVEGADFFATFDHLAFHTPFGGMVKGAHRKAMRAFTDIKPREIQLDFEQRVVPSLKYCIEVGGIYSATLYLALCSLIDNNERLTEPKRIGLFSYGSGCASEFYSGVITAESQDSIRAMGIADALNARYSLSMAEYEQVVEQNREWGFGSNDKMVDTSAFGDIYQRQMSGKGHLVFKGVKDFQRIYEWS